MITWMLACADPTSTGIAPRTDSGFGDFAQFGPDLVVVDAEIGSYAGEWVFPSVPVAEAFELVISWDGLTADGWGEERAPDSFDRVALFHASVDHLGLQDALGAGTAGAVITEQWVAPLVPEQVDLTLSDLGVDPTALVEDPEQSWLIALCDDDGDRLDLRTGLFLEPSAAATGFFVTLPTGAHYTFTSGFQGGLRTEPGYDTWTVDYGAVTVDAWGRPFDPSAADELFVGRFPGVVEGDDLGSQIHELAAVADGWWTRPTGGDTHFDLGSIDGFPGFDADAAWLVGVRCTTCLEPAPAWVVPITVR